MTFDRADRATRTDGAAPAAARRLTIGSRRDAVEASADHAATAVLENARPTGLAPRGASDTGTSVDAPASVRTALESGGQPLDGSTRSLMEERFAHHFSDVRVHTGVAATASARDIEANAYTVGRDIVFARDRYEPASESGRWLLAHELAHVVQNSGIAALSVVRRQHTRDAGAQAQRAGGGTRTAPARTAPAPAPRRDFVFIMGADRPRSGNPFYTMAERYYHAHLPGATFVTTVRTLADLLSWISTNVRTPIGNIYIVSHANEDGTLSFALNSADADARISVNELRGALHPAAGGAASLASVRTQVDASTRIHIKGCDIGRTQQMVELLDEAFGGAGTVTAPTHEQVFGTDPTLERAARAQFRAGVEASHPVPPPLDPSLQGAARRQAAQDRAAAMRQRQQDIRAELTARHAEEDRLAELANTFEAFSGPMFQRQGTQLFTSAELAPEVDRLYGHLTERQRAATVRGLVANDTRSASVANSQGTFRQRGQRVYRHTTLRYTMDDPQTAAEANRLYRGDFVANHFTATGAPTITRTPASGGFRISVAVPGRVSIPRQPAFDDTRTFTSSDVIPDDATLLARGRQQVPNPEKYAWRVATSHSSATGKTTRSVIGERVVAYLHHGTLDVAAHQHFDRPESDPRFFATSRFAPPRPPARGSTPARRRTP